MARLYWPDCLEVFLPRSSVLAALDDQTFRDWYEAAGEQALSVGADYHLFIEDPRLACLFKLTWGGK